MSLRSDKKVILPPQKSLELILVPDGSFTVMMIGFSSLILKHMERHSAFLILYEIAPCGRRLGLRPYDVQIMTPLPGLPCYGCYLQVCVKAQRIQGNSI